MKTILSLIVFAISLFGYSQIEKDTTKLIKLDRVVVSSQRFAKQKRTISQQVESISKKEIELQNNQNTADIFSNMGMLSVQKSQQGGGSPVIRGFESSRILLMVDGIRMNNLIYRAGHLQNSITVDKNMLENIDVLFGPSSTIYGSDALGGAINLQTKNAKLLSENGNNSFSGNVLGNYSSVNIGKSGHFDVNYASSKFASLTSFSYNDYGDLKMGTKQNGNYDYFGERNFYTQTVNGVDFKVANDDKYIQKFSAYKQYDFMQKLVFQQSSTLRHSINFQYSTTNDIPRFDRLTDLAGNSFDNAVWNYGPQKRLLGAYNLKKEKIFAESDLNLTLSYQNMEESRTTRKFGKPDLTSRIEDISVFALNSDIKTKIGKADLIYGLDVVYDNVKSNAFKVNILTNVEGLQTTRYPDGKNNTFSGEGFVYFNNKINERTSYNASARAGYKVLKSTIDTNSLKTFFNNIEQKNMVYSAAAGIVNNPSKNIKLSVNISSGFRVPNVDDLSKVFESSKVKATLIVPNADLKPEKTVTADLGITFWDGNKFQLENVFFLTKMYDPIVTDKFLFNGLPTVDFDGTISKVTANQNAGKGRIAGLSTTLKAQIIRNLTFYGTFNFTNGRFENDKGNFPLDHIPPVYGKTGFRYENKYVNLDLNMNYNGNKNIKEYAPVGEDNPEYARANGNESWQAYNFKAGIFLIKNTTIFTGIENILDTQYRTFASGLSAGGRNIYFGAKYNF